MNVIKQSNWKFWVAVEMATLEAADLILVCSMEKALLLAFQVLCSSELHNVFSACAGIAKYLFSSFCLEEQIVAKLEVY